MNKKNKNIKLLVVYGTLWDFTPINIMHYKYYTTKFVSFYDPWLKGYISENDIIKFNEKSKSFLLKPFKIINRTIKLLKIIREFKPDVVVSHHDDANISVLPIIFIVRKLLKENIVFVAFIRAGMDQYNSNSRYYKLCKFFVKHFYKYFDYVLTPSKGNARLIKNYFNLTNVRYHYNPVNLKEYQKLSKEPLEEKYQKIFKNSFVFINIGRLTEQKGQWFLIRAFKKVSEKYPNAKLIILGEGELRKQLEELIKKLNLQDKVFLLGRQNNVFKFLKNSHCFVFPSLWESFGNVLVEALSVNIPIISTDCKTGPREILCPELDIEEKINYPYYGKYGILTKPFPRRYIFKTLEEEPLIEEEKLLVELMIKMIEDEKLRKRYSNGLERAKDFDVEKIVKEWERVIKKVLNS